MPGAIRHAEGFEHVLGTCSPLARLGACQDHRQLDVLRGVQARHQVKELEDEPNLLPSHTGLLLLGESGDVNGVTYTYQVIALDAAGNLSGPSAPLQVTFTGGEPRGQSP